MATMTEREFLNKVLAIENLSTELNEYATESIDKLNARNAKRKNTLTKEQKENEEIMVNILAHFETNKSDTAPNVATALGISTQKASSLCRKLVDRNQLTVTDIKVKNKGTIKQYILVETETATEETAE